MNISGKTKICMSIGHPIGNSLSPLMHNTGFEKLKIDNEYVFTACNVKPENIENCIKGIRALGIRGVSVTMPHKKAIMQYLDDIDDTAVQIGAVNTIVNNDGKLTGFNTDWLGVVNSIQKVSSFAGKKALVLGAGGAARAAIFGLIKMGANVIIINRTDKSAIALADEFFCEYAPYSELERAKRMDIIVNTTSVGMHPDENHSPLPKQFITKEQTILDAVYFPYETQLIKNAKAQGAKAIHGAEMLLQQGLEQFKLYTGVNAPEETMRSVLIDHLKKQQI
ncbi:MAG TPA: shikimate dehydrogenase [Candidatus Saccharimonadales bacterium]|nr:shikimate dehydrogenase [Candidatus Saccharimonadales bacterium]